MSIIGIKRPFDPTIKEGHINYYDTSGLITSDYSEVFITESNDEIVASGYAKIKTDRPYLKHMINMRLDIKNH